MTTLWRWARKIRVNLLWLSAAVLAGLLLHLGAVLAAAHFGPNPAFAALSKLAEVNRMRVLEPVSAGHQPLPFMSPAERYAVCRFDLRKGPVAINAKLGGDDWVVAVFNPSGENVFAISGADLERRDAEVVLATSAESTGAPLPIARDGSVTTSIGLSDRTGIVVISAPATRAAYAAATERLLAAATCTQRARTEGATG